jgi:hypothetical protein
MAASLNMEGFASATWLPGWAKLWTETDDVKWRGRETRASWTVQRCTFCVLCWSPWAAVCVLRCTVSGMACEQTVSVCRGCKCDVIICTWEGQNVGGLLSERDRERAGGRLDDGNGWSKGAMWNVKSIYDRGWCVGGRTWLDFRCNS